MVVFEDACLNCGKTDSIVKLKIKMKKNNFFVYQGSLQRWVDTEGSNQ
ncbi:MAG: hypothetical protein MRJ93_07485 [Nitrososphaeraceae archaeon]|nr:hypothetical protein [Nitrososphaeraceae archaeon]